MLLYAVSREEINWLVSDHLFAINIFFFHVDRKQVCQIWKQIHLREAAIRAVIVVVDINMLLLLL